MKLLQFGIPALIGIGLIFLIFLAITNEKYEALCWEDQLAFGTHTETDVPLVKEQPVNCKYFIADEDFVAESDQ